MATPFPLRDRTAVVTGAASGIGRGVSLALARRGAHLALADLNAAGLAETAAAVEALGVRVSTHRLDVADREAVADLPEAVRAEHGGCAVVVNNAGVALGGLFEQTSEQDFDWLVSINFFGVVRMTRAFLPLLRDGAGERRIVNVSSLYGLIAPAGQTAYSASKFAVRGFSEALRKELEGTNVGVTTVHPGGVATSIARNARMSQSIPPEEAEAGRRAADRFLRLPPERAGEIIVQGVERRRARVLVGGDAKLLALVERIAPVGYGAVLRRIAPPAR